MKFVADEGVDLAIVVALRNTKHNVIYIAEKLAGITDPKSFRTCQQPKQGFNYKR